MWGASRLCLSVCLRQLHLLTRRSLASFYRPLCLQAGQLYARAGQHERAARMFLSCREFGLLDGVMAHAGSPQLWLEHAQAKEGGLM